MTKAKERQLIDAVQTIREERLGKKENLDEVKATIEDVVEAVEQLLLDGWDVPFGKTGYFKRKERKARKGYNPKLLAELKAQGVSDEDAKSQAQVDIAESVDVGFSASKPFKAELNA